MTDKPRFQVGDPVSVSSSSDYFEDWRGEQLYVIAVEFNFEKRHITYSTASEYPPNNRGDFADGWSEEDLSPGAPVL